MKVAKFEDFIKYANIFYTSIGIQPYTKEGSSRGKTFLAVLIFYVGVINMNAVLFGEIVYVAMALYNGNNFLEATMNMSYVGFVTVGCFKMLFIHLQKVTLTKVVNGLQKIYPGNIELQQQYNLHYYLKLCSRITLSFSVLYMVLISTYSFFSIMQYLIYDKWLNLRIVEKELPYYMYIPWNWQNHWSYYPLYFSESLAAYTSAAGQIASDLFLAACATQLEMHYDFISKSITNYKVQLEQNGEVDMAKAIAKDMDFLREIAEYHSYLLDLSDEINNVFGIPLLLNFSASSFIICFLGFQMTVGATPDTLAKLFLFLVTSIAQIYLICYYGQLLIDASVNVAHAVYNQNWSNADIRYQKMLILIAKRAQKPAQLKATTFVLISRGTMTEIMQLSYKFFALLRTMYVKN